MVKKYVVSSKARAKNLSKSLLTITQSPRCAQLLWNYRRINDAYECFGASVRISLLLTAVNAQQEHFIMRKCAEN